MNFDAPRIAWLAKQWDDLDVVRDEAGITRDGRKLIAHKPIYAQLEAESGVPWWFTAIVDMREGGIENLGTRHLHNGDRLSGYTVNVPAGRPKVGHGPPFTWAESALDSVQYQGLDKIGRFTIERALHLWEAYNGFKYAMQKPPRPSPYVFSCCDNYDPPGGPGGKVLVDHGPIEDVVDQQYGCAAMLLALMELDPTIKPLREAEAPTTLEPVHPATKKAATAIVVAGGATAGATVVVAHSSTWPPSLIFFMLVAVVVGGTLAWNFLKKD